MLSGQSKKFRIQYFTCCTEVIVSSGTKEGRKGDSNTYWEKCCIPSQGSRVHITYRYISSSYMWKKCKKCNCGLKCVIAGFSIFSSSPIFLASSSKNSFVHTHKGTRWTYECLTEVRLLYFVICVLDLCAIGANAI